MKKLKKIFNSNKSYLKFFLIGFGIAIITIYVNADTLFAATTAEYDNSNSSLSSTDVQGALDELYGVCSLFKPLYDVVKVKSRAVMDNTSSTYVTSSSGIDFSAISSDTNGKGVYIRSGTENDTYPIYYYRGAVENNNVLFANFCWKIVRTTKTGGVKLIYNGTPTDGTCDNTGENSQIGTSAFNSGNTSPAYVGYMYGTVYDYTRKDMSSQTGTWYFGNGVSYSNSTYTLTSTLSLDVSTWSSNYNTLNSNHYTCFSTGTTCSTVYYIYNTDSSYARYIKLTGGKKVEDALDEMLTSSSNTTNSTIKTTIDTWFETYMTGYTNYLEDTVWCNDRTIYHLNGWDPDGGSTTSYLHFSSYDRVLNTYSPNLECSNANDSFTVSSEIGNGALTYPVSLLTVDEIMLAGSVSGSANYSGYLYTGVIWYTVSPGQYNDYYYGVFSLSNSGGFGRASGSNSYGVRPSISLRNSAPIVSGSGSADYPYIVA